MKTNTSFFLRVATLSLLTSQVGQAAFTIQFSEQDGDVVAAASGAINSWSGLTLGSPDSSPDNSAVYSATALVGMGDQSSPWPGDIYIGEFGEWTAPGAFGSGTDFFYSDSETGSFPFVILQSGFYMSAGYELGTPFDHVSIWEDQSFSTLGLTPGTYTWSWAGDTATVQIGPVSAVPEPAAAFGTLGLLASGLLLRRRTRA